MLTLVPFLVELRPAERHDQQNKNPSRARCTRLQTVIECKDSTLRHECLLIWAIVVLGDPCCCGKVPAALKVAALLGHAGRHLPRGERCRPGDP